MSLQVRTDDIDIRSTIAALKGYDRRLQRETLTTIRRSARVIVRAAQANTPTEPPMSGWRTVPAANGRSRGGRGWPAWISPRRGIGQRTGRSTRIRSTGHIRWDLVRIVQRDPAGTIFEFARNGTGPTGGQFINNLNRDRQAPRAVWPAVDRHLPQVERDMMEAVRRAANVMNIELR